MALLNCGKKCIGSVRTWYRSLGPVAREWIGGVIIPVFFFLLLRTYVVSWYGSPTGSAEPHILVGDIVFGDKISYAFRDVRRDEYVMFDDPHFVFSKNPVQRLWQKTAGMAIPALGLTDGPTYLVKRVIGIPGDTLEGRLENGSPVIYRNGERLVEPYVNTYPLVHVRKMCGLVRPDSLVGSITPSFLRVHEETTRRVFNPGVSYEDQPFYLMTEEEVARNPFSNKPFFENADRPSRDASGRIVDIFGPITLEAGQYWVQGDNRRNSADSRFWGPVGREFIKGRVIGIIVSWDTEGEYLLVSLLTNPWKFFTKQVRYRRSFTSLPGAVCP